MSGLTLASMRKAIDEIFTNYSASCGGGATLNDIARSDLFMSTPLYGLIRAEHSRDRYAEWRQFHDEECT